MLSYSFPQGPKMQPRGAQVMEERAKVWIKGCSCFSLEAYVQFLQTPQEALLRFCSSLNYTLLEHGLAMKTDKTRSCFSYLAVKKIKKGGKKSRNKVQAKNEMCLTRLQHVDIALEIYSKALHLLKNRIH